MEAKAMKRLFRVAAIPLMVALLLPATPAGAQVEIGPTLPTVGGHTQCTATLWLLNFTVLVDTESGQDVWHIGTIGRPGGTRTVVDPFSDRAVPVPSPFYPIVIGNQTVPKGARIFAEVDALVSEIDRFDEPSPNRVDERGSGSNGDWLTCPGVADVSVAVFGGEGNPKSTERFLVVLDYEWVAVPESDDGPHVGDKIP